MKLYLLLITSLLAGCASGGFAVGPAAPTPPHRVIGLCAPLGTQPCYPGRHRGPT